MASTQVQERDFYDLTAQPDDRPLLVVHGNCQAESVRIVIDGPDVVTVRIPPAHELTADDLPHLERLLGEARMLVSQPVRADYHDLPIGTSQLRALMPRGSMLTLFPVIRFAGLYPTDVIVRPMDDPSATPPLVPYHDLGLIVTALRRRGDPTAAVVRLVPTAQQVLDIGERSLGELRSREGRHSTVRVSDLFAQPSFDQMRTLNHPGNSLWSALVPRIRRALGLAETVTDPGRPILSSVHAPRLTPVIEAYGIDAEPLESWTVDGRLIAREEWETAHLEWYREHPSAVDAALLRYADTLESLVPQ